MHVNSARPSSALKSPARTQRRRDRAGTVFARCAAQRESGPARANFAINRGRAQEGKESVWHDSAAGPTDSVNMRTDCHAARERSKPCRAGDRVFCIGVGDCCARVLVARRRGPGPQHHPRGVSCRRQTRKEGRRTTYRRHDNHACPRLACNSSQHCHG